MTPQEEIQERLRALSLPFLNLNKADVYREQQPSINDLGEISPALVGGHRFTDVDGVSEILGNELEIETKRVLSITEGQRIRFERTTLPGCNKTVFVVYTTSGYPRDVRMLRRYSPSGHTPWEACTYPRLLTFIHEWSLWAAENPTPQLLASSAREAEYF
jgi:hypothetical protein